MVYVVEVVVAVFGEVEELDEELLVCVRDVDEVLLCVCVVEGVVVVELVDEFDLVFVEVVVV